MRGHDYMSEIAGELWVDNPDIPVTSAEQVKDYNQVDPTTNKPKTIEQLNTEFKTAIQALENATGNTTLVSRVNNLWNLLGTEEDVDNAINKFNEVVAFLDDIEETDRLNSLLDAIRTLINAKANKSDLYVEQGYGANADKVTIILGEGIGKSATVLKEHQDISGKANTADLATVATSGDYNDLTNKPTIPSLNGYATKAWVGEQGFLTAHQDISGKVDKVTGKGLSTNDYTTEEKTKLGALPTNSDLQTALSGKQDTITDLSTIRSGAAAGATAIQPADIAALDATESGTSTDGKVSVEVTETDGVVTGVEVTTNDIASASALSAEVARAQGVEANKANAADVYTKQEVNGLVSTPHQNYVTVADYASLPSSGQATDTIYRVSNYDGTQVDTTKYAEYAWNGTQYVLLSVKSAVGEVFDISDYNSGSIYNSLSEALGTNGANVPVNNRKAGMSIKFIKRLNYDLYSVTVETDTNNAQLDGWSSATTIEHELVDGTDLVAEAIVANLDTTVTNDHSEKGDVLAAIQALNLNGTAKFALTLIETVEGDGDIPLQRTYYYLYTVTKTTNEATEYVQYRLMSTAWSIATSDWQGVDDIPTAGSNNLVRSGGVQKELAFGAVYDVSAKNPTAGPNNDGKFDSLSALLSDANLNTIIPTAVRKGGMSIKFIQSSDNTYVQYRYMGTAVTGNPNPFLNEANWSFCGDDQIIECNEYIHVKTDAEGKILWAIKTDGKIYYGAGVPQQIVDYINEKIAELSLDEYEDIVAFMNGIEEGDKTIQQLLNEKVDTEEGKSLIDEIFASTQEAVESPEYLEVSVDSENKIIEGTKADGTKHITGDLQVDGYIINPGIQRQIDDAIEDMQEQVDDTLESAEEIISYFDSVENPELLEVKTDSDGKVIAGRDKNGRAKEFVGLDVKNLNAEEITTNNITTEEITTNRIDTEESTVGTIEVEEEIILSDEAKGKLKEELKEELNVEDDIPYNDSIFTNGRIIKVYNPYKNGGNNQYTGQMHCHSWSYVRYNGVMYKVPLGYTVEDIAAMTEEQRTAAVLSVNTQFVAAHKNVGYDFMTITNYDTFADYTEAPATLPENFIWLGNGFEASTGGWDDTGQAEDQGAHIVVINTNFGKQFRDYAPKDVIKYAEDRGAVCNYAHPFISCLYSSPEYVRQIKSRLRFIEVFNGLSYYHADVAPGVPPVKPNVEIDEDFDALLSQGNFVFGTAVSDHRNLGKTSVQRNQLKTGCVKVFANELTHKAIWEALLSGNFYCTEFADYELLGVSLIGNVYTINVGEADVTVEFLDEDNNILSTVVTTSENMVATYAIQGTEKFVRARLYQPFEDPTFTYNHRKRQMWTQPIFLAKEIL